MPFVQRKRKSGEIIGVYANPQPQPDGSDLAPEELPEDHPDLREFYRRHPSPPMPRLTEADIRQMERDREKLEQESKSLSNATAAFVQTFGELETALAALLAVIINKSNSQMGYALYFSPDGFHARVKLVADTLKQFLFESDLKAPYSAAELEGYWAKVWDRLNSLRVIRNTFAHGMPQVLHIRGKAQVVLVSPSFDPNRVGRRIPKGQVPGLKAPDLRKATKDADQAAYFVDQINRMIAAFHEDDDATFQRISLWLAGNL